ncbi:uncharacterized protein LOC131672163 [Phymastichus coffea]|uniref:uncharacterized protein LOC131672163 n=1 Tax=Phymastichus coffea TaxID=108790 RepID=UPI00273CF3D9|nr:uncharacterized protein LOC131672163 [Phymastichus coffea]
MISRIAKRWSVFAMFCLIAFHNEAFARKRICVIGAGRSGLSALRVVSESIDKFEPIAIERNSDVGGLWIYRDDPEKDEHGIEAPSGIYKNLRTITPIASMIYPDYPTFLSGEIHEFVSHQTFLEYMRNFTSHFQLRQYIQFNTLVTKVKPAHNGCRRGKISWLLKKLNLNMNVSEEIICDGVIVCSGLYSKPYMPEIPGLTKTFPGQILHSRNYRVPQPFTNKTVVILGGAASALGIAADLSKYATTIYLSSRKSIDQMDMLHAVECNWSLLEKWKIVPQVIAADGNHLILKDNSTITADAFIFCTGYMVDFPFLDVQSGVKFDAKHKLYPLTKGYINKIYQSMAFIGLRDSDYAFPGEQYSEVKYFLKWLEEH